jgi:hypothetical protein
MVARAGSGLLRARDAVIPAPRRRAAGLPLPHEDLPQPPIVASERLSAHLPLPLPPAGSPAARQGRLSPLRATRTAFFEIYATERGPPAATAAAAAVGSAPPYPRSPGHPPLSPGAAAGKEAAAAAAAAAFAVAEAAALSRRIAAAAADPGLFLSFCVRHLPPPAAAAAAQAAAAFASGGGDGGEGGEGLASGGGPALPAEGVEALLRHLQVPLHTCSIGAAVLSCAIEFVLQRCCRKRICAVEPL